MSLVIDKRASLFSYYHVFTLGIHNALFSTNRSIIDIRCFILFSLSFLVLYTSDSLLFHTTILRFSASSSTFLIPYVVFENGIRCARFFAYPSDQQSGGDPGNSTRWKLDTKSLVICQGYMVGMPGQTIIHFPISSKNNQHVSLCLQ